MNWWSEAVKLRLMLAGIILFVLSGFFSCKEFKYRVWGKETTATLGQVRHYVSRGRYGDKPKTNVQYHFMDGDQMRQESTEVNGTIEPEQTFTVEYLPGTKSSRIKGQSEMLWVCIFVGSLLFSGFMIWKWSRED